jgi:hypothetical protein
MKLKHLLALALTGFAALSTTQAQAQTLNVQHEVLNYTYSGPESVIGFNFNLASSALFPSQPPVAFTNLYVDGTFYAGPSNGYWNSFNLNSSSTSLTHQITFDAASFGTVQFTPTFSFITKPNTVANFVPATTVPEPESYALMLAGLGAMAFLGRRRKAG